MCRFTISIWLSRRYGMLAIQCSVVLPSPISMTNLRSKEKMCSICLTSRKVDVLAQLPLHARMCNYTTTSRMENVFAQPPVAWRTYLFNHLSHGKRICSTTSHMENVFVQPPLTWRTYLLNYLSHGERICIM